MATIFRAPKEYNQAASPYVQGSHSWCQLLHTSSGETKSGTALEPEKSCERQGGGGRTGTDSRKRKENKRMAGEHDLPWQIRMGKNKLKEQKDKMALT